MNIDQRQRNRTGPGDPGRVVISWPGAGLSLGTVALGQLLAGGSCASRSGANASRRVGVASLSAASQASHLSVHERRAVAARHVRLQAAAERKERRRSCRSRCGKGQRLTGMSGNQASLPLGGFGVSIRSARATVVPGSASCCRTRRTWSTRCASCGRCSPRRSITIRPSRSFKPVRRSPGGRRSAPG